MATRSSKKPMKQYEVIWEIQNSCSRNQMRDVAFDEIECDDPAFYVRGKFPGKDVRIDEDRRADGSLVLHAEVDGLRHVFVFSEI